MSNELKKELSELWYSVQYLVFLSAVVYVVILAVRYFSLGSSDLASWVQAVGSIASIWGAIWISTRQQREQRRLVTDESVARLNSTYALLEGAVETALEAIENERKYRDVPFMFDRMWKGIYADSLFMSIEALKSVSVHELGSAGLVRDFMAVRACLVRIHRAPNPQETYQVVKDESFMSVEFNNQANLLNAFWARFGIEFEARLTAIRKLA